MCRSPIFPRPTHRFISVLLPPHPPIKSPSPRPEPSQSNIDSHGNRITSQSDPPIADSTITGPGISLPPSLCRYRQTRTTTIRTSFSTRAIFRDRHLARISTTHHLHSIFAFFRVCVSLHTHSRFWPLVVASTSGIRCDLAGAFPYCMTCSTRPRPD